MLFLRQITEQYCNVVKSLILYLLLFCFLDANNLIYIIKNDLQLKYYIIGNFDFSIITVSS